MQRKKKGGSFHLFILQISIFPLFVQAQDWLFSACFGKPIFGLVQLPSHVKERPMKTITLSVSDDAADKLLWMLRHFKDEVSILEEEAEESEEDRLAFVQAKREQQANDTVSFDQIAAQRTKAV